MSASLLEDLRSRNTLQELADIMMHSQGLPEIMQSLLGPVMYLTLTEYRWGFAKP